MAKNIKVELTENQVWDIVRALRNDSMDNEPKTIASYKRIVEKLGYEF